MSTIADPMVEFIEAMKGLPPEKQQAINNHLKHESGISNINVISFFKDKNIDDEVKRAVTDRVKAAIENDDIESLPGSGLSAAADRVETQVEEDDAPEGVEYNNPALDEDPEPEPAIKVTPKRVTEPKVKVPTLPTQAVSDNEVDDEVDAAAALAAIGQLLKAKQPKVDTSKIDKEIKELSRQISEVDSVAASNVSQLRMEITAEFEKLAQALADTRSIDINDVNNAVDSRIRSTHQQLMQSYVDSVSQEVVSGQKMVAPTPRPMDTDYVSTDNGAYVGLIIKAMGEHQKTWELSVGLRGHSGTSKTYLLKNELSRAGKPYILQSFHEQTRYKDIVGHQVLKKTDSGSYTEFHIGSLIRAMKLGIVYIADEIDKASPALCAVMHTALEYGEYTIEETGEVIVAQPGFAIFATCNGLGDDTGMYSGHRMDNALVQRFYWLHAQYLPEATEIQIFRNAGVEKEQAKHIRAFLDTARAQLAARKITFSPSTRTGTKIARAISIMGLGLKEAIEMTCLNTLTPGELKAMNIEN